MFLLLILSWLAVSVLQFALILSLSKKLSQMRKELDKQSRALRAIKMIMDMVGERSKSRGSHSLANR